MRKYSIPRSETSFFSPISNVISYQQDKLLDFVSTPFNIDAFKKQMEQKKSSFSAKQRSLIYTVFLEQLQEYLHFPKVKEHIELLQSENTFTVTAGHQLNLYGGPLYSIYKIMDVIRLAEELHKKYPSSHFVPVFWMATEDHDFEEINHLHLFGDTLAWNSNQKGPVGRFELQGIKEFKQSITEKFQNHPDFTTYLNQFYTSGNLAEATRAFLMDLAGDYGVLILDADDVRLKASFSTILKKELTEQFTEPLIKKQIKKLEEAGFQGQATARPINLFYIKDQLRERIVPLNDGGFEVGALRFTLEELLKELQQFPERFSPNVVLRPLYQEFILPNLCYLGGGGEMAYWLELKAMFNAVKVPFPLIKVRNSIQWIDKTVVKKLKKIDFEFQQVFKSIDETKKTFVFQHADNELDFSLMKQCEDNLGEQLIKDVLLVDKGLEGYAKSEVTKIQNQLNKLQQKLIRHQKQKSEGAMQQIDGIYERLFPDKGLEERYDNVIPFLAKMGKTQFISIIYESINPFQEDLVVLVDE